MKVLFVYRYLTLGGVEAVLRTRLELLPALGVDARAWFLHDLGGAAMFDGVSSRVRVGSFEECARELERSGVDLLVSIDTEEIIPLVARTSRRWAIECHSGYVENLSYLGRLAANPTAVLVPSEEQRRLIVSRLGDAVPVRVVPNPLGSGFTTPLTPFVPPPPRPVVAWVGRLDRLKNWRGFLAVGRLLLAQGHPLELWLIGRVAGEATADDLRDTARGESVLPHLRWYASVPHQRMPRLLDAVRDSGGLVVSTSLRESFGLSIVEAMARGCAVVVPDQSPLRELVTPASCRYPPGAIDAAARRVAALLVDHGRRREIGAEVHRIALERFAPAAAIGQLAAELRRLVA